MSRFATEYFVPRATGHCAATGQPLQPGEACIATLVERLEDDGFDRQDYSLQAWQAGARPPRLYSFWKSTVPTPDAKPKILLDDTVLLDLFERLASDQRPQRVAFRFVLALILMRKKLLKFVGRRQEQREHEPATETWLLQPRRTSSEVIEGEPAPFGVINPNLSEDDVRELISQLSEILQSDL